MLRPESHNDISQLYAVSIMKLRFHNLAVIDEHAVSRLQIRNDPSPDIFPADHAVHP